MTDNQHLIEHPLMQKAREAVARGEQSEYLLLYLATEHKRKDKISQAGFDWARAELRRLGFIEEDTAL